MRGARKAFLVRKIKDSGPNSSFQNEASFLGSLGMANGNVEYVRQLAIGGLLFERRRGNLQMALRASPGQLSRCGY